MPNIYLLCAITIAAGAAVAFQGQFMGAMDRSAGTATSMFVTYGGGAVLAALLWLFFREPSAARPQLPWYGWLAGPLGLVIVGGIGYAAPRLGLARTLVITVAAQLLAALVLDHVSAQRTFDVTRALGLLLTAGGVWLIVR
jgi:transporter family-2 protein